MGEKLTLFRPTFNRSTCLRGTVTEGAIDSS